MTLFIAISVLTLYFLVKWNIKLRRTVVQDTTMFKMSQLRGEVIEYTQEKWQTLGKSDVKYAIKLVDLTSFTIDNHKEFYDTFTLKQIKNSVVQHLIAQRKEIEHTKTSIDEIHNKTIKSMYAKFAMILLENIKEHTFFFKFRLVFAIFKVFIAVMFSRAFVKKMDSYKEWISRRESDFSKYGKTLYV